MSRLGIEQLDRCRTFTTLFPRQKLGVERTKVGWRDRWERVSSGPVSKSPVTKILSLAVARAQWKIVTKLGVLICHRGRPRCHSCSLIGSISDRYAISDEGMRYCGSSSLYLSYSFHFLDVVLNVSIVPVTFFVSIVPWSLLPAICQLCSLFSRWFANPCALIAF